MGSVIYQAKLFKLPARCWFCDLGREHCLILLGQGKRRPGGVDPIRIRQCTSFWKTQLRKLQAWEIQHPQSERHIQWFKKKMKQILELQKKDETKKDVSPN